LFEKIDREPMDLLVFDGFFLTGKSAGNLFIEGGDPLFLLALDGFRMLLPAFLKLSEYSHHPILG